MSAKQRITEADLNRLKRALRDAAARGQFDPDPTVDNHSILGIRAMRGWFPVCDCVSAGDLPVIWYDTVHCGTLLCTRREFLDALQALLLLARNDPRSFVEGFGRDVLNRIEDWSSRFYRWIDSDGVQV